MEHFPQSLHPPIRSSKIRCRSTLAEFFVPLSDRQARKKVNALMRYFATQRNKQWFSEDLFYGLMRLRSIEGASPTRHAEAFHCPKLLLGRTN